MGNHPISLMHLFVKIAAGRLIIAPCQLGGFRKGPTKILVPVFFVAFALLFAIAAPSAAYFPAVRNIIARFWKTIHGAAFQHNGQPQYLAHPRY